MTNQQATNFSKYCKVFSCYNSRIQPTKWINQEGESSSHNHFYYLFLLSFQFIRFYGLYVPTFFVIQVLMSLSWQLKKLSSDGKHFLRSGNLQIDLRSEYVTDLGCFVQYFGVVSKVTSPVLILNIAKYIFKIYCNFLYERQSKTLDFICCFRTIIFFIFVNPVHM